MDLSTNNKKVATTAAVFDGPIIPMPTISNATVRNSHLLAVVDALKAEARELRDEIDVKNQTVISLGNTLFETQQNLHAARLTAAQQMDQLKLFTGELVTLKNSENLATSLREQIKRLESELNAAEETVAAPLKQELELMRQQRESDDSKLIDWKNQVKTALKEGKKRESALSEDRERLKKQLADAELKITELGFQLERVSDQNQRRAPLVDDSTMTDVGFSDEQWQMLLLGGVGGGMRGGLRIQATSPVDNESGNTMSNTLSHLRIPTAADALAPTFSYEPVNTNTAPSANPLATASLQLAAMSNSMPTAYGMSGGSPAIANPNSADWGKDSGSYLAPNYPSGSAAAAAIEHSQIPLYWYFRPTDIERSLFLGLSPLQQRVVSLGRKHFYSLLEAEKTKETAIDGTSANNTFVVEGDIQPNGVGGDGGNAFPTAFPLPSAPSSAKTFSVAVKGSALPTIEAMNAAATSSSSAAPFIVTVRFSGKSDAGQQQTSAAEGASSSPQQQGWSLDAKMLVKPGMTVYDLIVLCCGKFSMRYDSQIDPSQMALSIHHEPSKRRVTLAAHREMHSYSYVALKAQKGDAVVFSLVESNNLSESVQRYMDTQV